MDFLQKKTIRGVRVALLVYAGLLLSLWTLAMVELYHHDCHLFDRFGAPGPGQMAIMQCSVHPYTFSPVVNFSDLTDYAGKLRHIVPTDELAKGSPVYNYPAPAAFVYSWMLSSSHPVRVFSSLVIAGLLSSAMLLSLGLRRVGGDTAAQIALWISVVCLGPFGYILWRSNIEGIVWLLVCASMASLFAKRFTASAVFLGFAVCIKPFPVLLFLLLLKMRRFKEVVIGIAVVVACDAIALHSMGPSIIQANKLLSRGVVLYKEIYIQNFRPTEARFQHSILDTMKALEWHFHPNQLAQGDSILMLTYHIYLVLAPIILLGTAWIFRKQPSLNQLFAIVIIILTLAPVGAEYTLALLYLPWAGLLLHLAQDVPTGRTRYSMSQLLAVLVPCALVFAPINYLRYYGGSFKCVVLYLLLVAIRVTPMPSTIFGEIREPQAQSS